MMPAWCRPLRRAYMAQGKCNSNPWRKSSYSGYTECLEAATSEAGVLIRQSKEPLSEPIGADGAAFGAWMQAVKAGEYDDFC
jgi:hypothetical protein